MGQSISENNIKEILEAFGLDHGIMFRQVYHSAWDIADTYILKRCDSLDELKKSIWFSGFLGKRKIPIRKYLKTPDGQYDAEVNGVKFCLMTKLKGNHIDPYAGNARTTGEMLGGIVARLHLVLKKAQPPFDIYDSDMIAELNGWITDTLASEGITVRNDILQKLRALEPLYRGLPRQLIHRDMHLQNLLFDGGNFTGYLDFDISQKNIRIYDLCYMGASMLVGNYADTNRLKIWQEIFSGVISGYEVKLRLTADEKEAIPLIFVLIELTFAAWFLMQRQADTARGCLDMAEWCFDHSDAIKAALQ